MGGERARGEGDETAEGEGDECVALSAQAEAQEGGAVKSGRVYSADIVDPLPLPKVCTGSALQVVFEHVDVVLRFPSGTHQPRLLLLLLSPHTAALRPLLLHSLAPHACTLPALLLHRTPNTTPRVAFPSVRRVQS